jgi:hypothetical protein
VSRAVAQFEAETEEEVRKATAEAKAAEAAAALDDPPPINPVVDAIYAGLDRDQEDLRDILSRVRWVKSSLVSHERFRELKAQAALDTFSELSPRDRRAEMIKLFPRLAKVRRFSERIRRSKAYERIVERLLAAREKAKDPGELTDRITEGAEDAFDALHSTVIRGQGKERFMAAKEFTDRASPKRQDAIHGQTVVIPIAIGEALNAALGVLAEKTGRKPIDIAAPTPKQLEE